MPVRWVLPVALACLLTFGLIAAVMQKSARVHQKTTRDSARDLVNILNRAQPTDAGPRPPWVVKDAYSGHYALVMDVEADKPESAVEIAHEVVEPVRSKYVEILVYVRKPGSTEVMPSRRVQWTAAGGYVETIFN